MFKVINNLAATIIDDLFATYHSYPNNIVTIFAQNLSLLFQLCVQFITVRILYSISYRSLIWNLMAGYIKDSESLDIFKSKIRKWKAINCPCCLCKKYIPNKRFIHQIWFIFFAYSLVAYNLNGNHIHDGGGERQGWRRQKDPHSTSFSPLISVNVRISPQNSATLSFDPFTILLQNFKFLPSASPK